MIDTILDRLEALFARPAETAPPPPAQSIASLRVSIAALEHVLATGGDPVLVRLLLWQARNDLARLESADHRVFRRVMQHRHALARREIAQT